MLNLIDSVVVVSEVDEYESLPTTSSVTSHMVAGAMAGMMEHVVMYPLDSVKVNDSHSQLIYLQFVFQSSDSDANVTSKPECLI